MPDTAETTEITKAKSARTRRAVNEKNGKVKNVDFRGVTLTVPATCPGEVLFDIGDDNVTSTLRTLLGGDQYVKVREQVRADKLSLTETVDSLTDFLNSIFSETYGLTSGE